MQGEHLVLAAFARQKFLLVGEETSVYKEVKWEQTKHNLDFIVERDGVGYGVEVKNTLGYMDIDEFIAKVRCALHIGVTPVFSFCRSRSAENMDQGSCTGWRVRNDHDISILSLGA